MLTHYNSIISALEATPHATKSLRRALIGKGYLFPNDSSTAEQLVTLILKQIELSADQYGEFIIMLRNIPGMDLTTKTLTSMIYYLLFLFFLAMGGQKTGFKQFS